MGIAPPTFDKTSILKKSTGVRLRRYFEDDPRQAETSAARLGLGYRFVPESDKP